MNSTENSVSQPPEKQPSFASVGLDPGFLKYLQSFLSKPKNADAIKGKKISSDTIIDGQVLIYDKATNLWKPITIFSGITTTVTLAKLTGGGSNGSLTITKGIITAVTNPT